MASGSRLATLAKQEKLIWTTGSASGRSKSRNILPGHATRPDFSASASSIRNCARSRWPPFDLPGPAICQRRSPHAALRAKILDLGLAEIHHRPPGFDDDVVGTITIVIRLRQRLVSEQRQRVLRRGPFAPRAFCAQFLDCAGLGIKCDHPVSVSRSPTRGWGLEAGALGFDGLEGA